MGPRAEDGLGAKFSLGVVLALRSSPTVDQSGQVRHEEREAGWDTRVLCRRQSPASAFEHAQHHPWPVVGSLV
jgi:hypothetical protein